MLTEADSSQVDIVIVGAGIVGLSTAALLAKLNVKIVILDTHTPAVAWGSDEPTPRISAINVASQALLSEMGCWQTIEPSSCSPMRHVHAWDDTGGGAIHFDGADLLHDRLSTIVENRAIIKALWEQLEKQSCVTRLTPYQLTQFTQHTDHVALQVANCNNLNDASTSSQSIALKTQLLIAADGGRSRIREQLAIPVTTSSYQQQAIIAVIEADKPHNHVGLQNFLTTGPLGLLPMHHDKQYNMIWSCQEEAAAKLLALSDAAFMQLLTHHMNGHFTNAKLVTSRVSIPLTERHAKQYVDNRVVLVGDAAHTIHPLAGQGANIGLQDALRLYKSLRDVPMKHSALHTKKYLRQYERASKAMNQKMVDWMRLFHEAFTSSSKLVRLVRSTGLNAANELAWLKHFLLGDTFKTN